MSAHTAVLSCKGTQNDWIVPYRGIPRMRVTFSQLTCLYQFWRVMAVSAIWTFLTSAGFCRGTSAGFADMMTGGFVFSFSRRKNEWTMSGRERDGDGDGDGGGRKGRTQRQLRAAQLKSQGTPTGAMRWRRQAKTQLGVRLLLRGGKKDHPTGLAVGGKSSAWVDPDRKKRNDDDTMRLIGGAEDRQSQASKGRGRREAEQKRPRRMEGWKE